MKKILILLSLLTIFSTTVFAQENGDSKKEERDESKWSSLSYVNVPVLKVLEGVDAYVVVYQKNKTGVGNVIIPKKWASGNPEEPRKLKFRDSKNNKNAFMTVVKKEGEFHRVILTVPMNKRMSIWGNTASKKPIEGADKDTLEELEL